MRSGLMRMASRKMPRSAAILRYHSVLSAPEDFSISIGSGIIHSAAVFSRQMEQIASSYHPVSLDQVCAFVRGETNLPPRSVAITFDDGFADNLEIAAPILARYGIPASIYLAVDYIGNRVQPWYCRLRNAFFSSTVRQWKVDENTLFDMTVPKQRYQAFLDSSRKCAKLCRTHQEDSLAQIESRLDVEPFTKPVMLTWEGVRQLIRQGHIIGSHTLSHPNVAYIGPHDLSNELVASKAEIEKHTTTTVHHFSYPSPIMEPHYTNESTAAARAAGYISAVTCTTGTAMQGDNALTLKRISAKQTPLELEWALENAFLGRFV